jgi:hypothetical protein
MQARYIEFADSRAFRNSREEMPAMRGDTGVPSAVRWIGWVTYGLLVYVLWMATWNGFWLSAVLGLNVDSEGGADKPNPAAFYAYAMGLGIFTLVLTSSRFHQWLNDNLTCLEAQKSIKSHIRVVLDPQTALYRQEPTADDDVAHHEAQSAD